MAWHDGTYEEDIPKLEKDNVKVCDGLYKSKVGDTLFFVNSFPKGSEHYALSDPHKEGRDYDYVFYHAFLGENAKKAKEAIEEFLSKGYGEKEASIRLYRADSKRFFSYGYGVINRFLLRKQEDLKELLPESTRSEGCFLAPLSIFRFACPVCGRRTLGERGMNEICPECGWEDDAEDDENWESPANGETTIKEARQSYLRAKLKDPNYNWSGEMETNHSDAMPLKDATGPDLEAIASRQLPRDKAIYLAITLGERFITNYDRYFKSPSSEKGADFVLEMEGLYRKIKEITIEPDGKELNRTQMDDWFFTAGSSPEEFLKDDREISAYDDFCNHLLIEGDVTTALLKAKK